MEIPGDRGEGGREGGRRLLYRNRNSSQGLTQLTKMGLKNSGNISCRVVNSVGFRGNLSN